MRNLKKNLARFLPVWIPLLVVIADRVSKVYIQHAITAFDAVSVIPGWLRIVHSENPGAAFGVLAEGNPILRAAVLIGVSSVVLVFVISALLGRGGAFAATPARVGLSLVLGGAMGNLFDRIVYGTVTDFIEVYHGYWSFPAFNVADSAITVGAVLLLWDLIRPRHKALPEDARLAHK